VGALSRQSESATGASPIPGEREGEVEGINGRADAVVSDCVVRAEGEWGHVAGCPRLGPGPPHGTPVEFSSCSDCRELQRTTVQLVQLVHVRAGAALILKRERPQRE
jgi:hypothetical protein